VPLSGTKWHKMAQRVAQYLFDWQVISILEFLAEIYAMVLAQWHHFSKRR